MKSVTTKFSGKAISRKLGMMSNLSENTGKQDPLSNVYN